MFCSAHTHMQSADFWSISKPKEKAPSDTGHLKINMFPKTQARLAPYNSHLEALRFLFSPCPPSTPSAFRYIAGKASP